jgi:hypothetical protein
MTYSTCCISILIHKGTRVHTCLLMGLPPLSASSCSSCRYGVQVREQIFEFRRCPHAGFYTEDKRKAGVSVSPKLVARPRS